MHDWLMTCRNAEHTLKTALKHFTICEIYFTFDLQLESVTNVNIVCLNICTGYMQLDWRTGWRNGTVHPLQLTSKEAQKEKHAL